MAEMNDEVIRKVANLARLEITEDEVVKYASEIAKVLQHVDQLQQLNTDGIIPMTHGFDGGLRMRDDEVLSDQELSAKVLQSASNAVDSGYKVPQVI